MAVKTATANDVLLQEILTIKNELGEIKGILGNGTGLKSTVEKQGVAINQLNAFSSNLVSKETCNYNHNQQRLTARWIVDALLKTAPWVVMILMLAGVI